MPQTPRTSEPHQPSKTRGQPQPDSLETDDRGTRPYQKQSQNQTQRQAGGDKPEDDPNFIGDPPPDNDDTIRADGNLADDGDPLPPDRGVVENVDPPLSTDDNGELGSSSERH